MKSASQRSNVSLENQAPADVTEGSPAPKPSAFRDKLEEQLGAMNHSPSPSPIAAGAPEPSVDDSMLAPSNTHAAYAAQADRAVNDDLAREHAQLRDNLERERSEWASREKELRAQADDARRELNAARADAAEASAQLDAANSKVAAARLMAESEAKALAEAEAHKAEIAKLQTAKADADAEVAQKADELKLAKDDIAAYLTKNEELSAKVSKAVKKGKGIEVEKKQLETTVAELRTQLDQAASAAAAELTQASASADNVATAAADARAGGGATARGCVGGARSRRRRQG